MTYGLVKGLLQLAAGLGGGFIVTDVVRATVPASSGLLRNVCKSVATFALGGLVGDLASKYTGELMDTIFNRKEKEEAKVEPVVESSPSVDDTGNLI
jgi:hypothetical protein